jgi:hypothetical protein
MIHKIYHDSHNVSLDESQARSYPAPMGLSCPVDLDVKRLRAEVQSIYSRVAGEPDGEFHFHRGPAYAAAQLGYDAVVAAGNRASSAAS